MTAADIQEKLAPSLAALGVTDPDFTDALAACSTVHYFDKEQSLVQANQHPKYFGFITRGLFRYYYIGAEGKERNKSFYTENLPVGSLNSQITGEPCPFTIEALEPSEAILTPTAKIAALEQYPAFQDMLNLITRQHFLRNERREAMLLTLGAEQRYQWLLDHEPHLASRVPQYHLASYLGMDAVSLSRIKKNLKP
ncbi:MAG: hypothetical protein AseanaTS_16660 [Candidatus Pelagadaptatus aseana]|uniref:Crp/Fnr family transcriptional regulator n=1 Tax=Candidatus Pelagadaptatus aseana TaxID=3120508 RepID=UPI0039B34F39